MTMARGTEHVARREEPGALVDAAKRLIRYMVVKGEVVLERRTGPRHD